MKKIISAFILIFVLFNISGCIEKKAAGREEQADITYRIKKLPEDLMTDMDDTLSYLLFDGLFIEEEGQVKKSLCSFYTVSDEYKCYDFSIKKGMLFSGGEMINALDFKLYFDFLKAEGLLDNVKSIKTLDTNTLRIELLKEDKNFIGYLTNPVFFLKNINDKGINIRNSYNKLHYSGPYNIAYISEKYILLKKNSKYHGKDLVPMESVKILIEPLDEMALALFEEGKIDIFSCFIDEKAGNKITLPSSINIVFKSREVFKTQQEKEGLIYELRDKLKLSEGREWTQKAKDAKESDITNTAAYDKPVNIFCGDNLSVYSDSICAILREKGYKIKKAEKESEENQISVKNEKTSDSPDVYPLINQNVYLYSKDVDGYYFTGSGILVLSKANKKAPVGS